MAKLIAGPLALEVEYRDIDKESWVNYDVRFLYDGEPLINTSLLRRDTNYWADRSDDAFRANEYNGDSLIHALDKVLSEKCPMAWQPLEPDITIGLYPGRMFPFTRFSTACNCGGAACEIPDDQYDGITIIAQVDTYNFRGEHEGYTGDGPALIMSVSHDELAAFRDALREEYEKIQRGD